MSSQTFFRLVVFTGCVDQYDVAGHDVRLLSNRYFLPCLGILPYDLVLGDCLMLLMMMIMMISDSMTDDDNGDEGGNADEDAGGVSDNDE